LHPQLLLVMPKWRVLAAAVVAGGFGAATSHDSKS